MSRPGRSINVMTGGGQFDGTGRGPTATAAWARNGEGRTQGNSVQSTRIDSPEGQGHQQPAVPTTPVRTSTKKLVIVIALAILLSVAALALTVAKWATRSDSATPVTTTISPPSPTYSDAEIASAKKDACSANTVTGAALTQAQRDLAAIPDRNSPEAKVALANFQMVVMVETEYLKTQVRPAAPQEVKSAVNDFIVALLAETDAETRMLPYEDINARGDVTSAASKKLDLACKD